MLPALSIRQHGGGQVEILPDRVRLSIPAGPAQQYRLAQIDDYSGLPRVRLPWRAPLVLRLRARVSAAQLPGTWGFGLWNDPFSAGLGLGGMSARLPVLPNAAWFFWAGAPNYLALRDDHPAQGFLAATFRAPRIPSLLLAPAVLGLPLLALRATARILRHAGRLMIRESGAALSASPLDWHAYTMEWQAGHVRFSMDDETVFQTNITPRGPLGLVIWIDNQFAAFPPSGRLRTGGLPYPQPAWLELADVTVNGMPLPLEQIAAKAARA